MLCIVFTFPYKYSVACLCFVVVFRFGLLKRNFVFVTQQWTHFRFAVQLILLSFHCKYLLLKVWINIGCCLLGSCIATVEYLIEFCNMQRNWLYHSHALHSFQLVYKYSFFPIVLALKAATENGQEWQCEHWSCHDATNKFVTHILKQTNMLAKTCNPNT